MSKPSPTDNAVMIAALLDRDPVMAAQVKNYISEARLIEVLDLKTPAENLAEQAVIQDPAPLSEMQRKG